MKMRRLRKKIQHRGQSNTQTSICRRHTMKQDMLNVTKQEAQLPQDSLGTSKYNNTNSIELKKKRKKNNVLSVI